MKNKLTTKIKQTLRILIVLAIVLLTVTLVGVCLVSLLSKAKTENGGTSIGKPEEETVYGEGTVQYGTSELPVLGLVNKNEYDSDAFVWRDGKLYYEKEDTETYFGIDVSAHQETIDWNAVKAAGVQFAIIRAGWRGNTEGGLFEDDYFKANIKGATDAGLDVGVYFYSQAVNEQEAAQEAEMTLKLIEDYNITYPVVYDWEYAGSGTRTADIDKITLDACARAFCERIKQAGYTPMVYFYQDIAYLHYSLDKIRDYDFWLAEYNETPQFFYDFKMLQYTNQGKLDGVNGTVDFNLSFVDYAKK